MAKPAEPTLEKGGKVERMRRRLAGGGGGQQQQKATAELAADTLHFVEKGIFFFFLIEAMRSQQTGLVQKGRKINTNKRVGEGWRVYWRGGWMVGGGESSPYLMRPQS